MLQGNRDDLAKKEENEIKDNLKFSAKPTIKTRD